MTAFEITLRYGSSGEADTTCEATAKVEIDGTIDLLLPPGMLEGAAGQLLEFHINTLRAYLEPPQAEEDLQADYSYFDGGF